MDKICLFGASGHGKVVKDILLSNNKKVDCFFDDNPNVKLDRTLVLSSDKIKNYLENKFIISIGDNYIRKKISSTLNLNFSIAIHKNATISNKAYISLGTVVMAGAIINANTKIGKHCIINTNSVVEHDCVISDFVHISPSATITGGVFVGEGTHVGTGAIIIPNIILGKWATIGAGAVVINDVPDNAVVVGNPGKIINIKENNK